MKRVILVSIHSQILNDYYIGLTVLVICYSIQKSLLGKVTDYFAKKMKELFVIAACMGVYVCLASPVYTSWLCLY